MSSSSRSATLLLFLTTLVAAGGLVAQQKYIIPQLSLDAEGHTNRELFTDSARQADTEVYKAIVGATFGEATPRGHTDVDARLDYQEFSERNFPGLFEGFLDLKSDYQFLRKTFDLEGHYERQDVVTAETGTANFDQSGNPVTIDSGTLSARGTRTLYDLAPTFSFDITERAFIESKLQYEAVRFNAAVNNGRVGFDSPYVEVTVGRRWGPTTDVSIGPYYTRYKSDDDATITKTWGNLITLHHDWSSVSNINVNLRLERSEHDQLLGTPSSDSQNSWGIEFVGYRKGEAGGLRYGIGRFLQPSTLGDRLEEDQVRLEYIRAFTQRVTFDGALRFARDRLANDPNSSNNRDRAFATLALSRYMTQRLILSGGYRFVYQKFSTADQKAHDQTLFLMMTYRGQKPEGYKALHDN